jgi:hypothetical protein
MNNRQRFAMFRNWTQIVLESVPFDPNHSWIVYSPIIPAPSALLVEIDPFKQMQVGIPL